MMLSHYPVIEKGRQSFTIVVVCVCYVQHEIIIAIHILYTYIHEQLPATLTTMAESASSPSDQVYKFL
jgi:hypothetical protein